ncbi:MAG: hypothetical protein K8R86_02550 [Bacteroidales bacterium]|nr:hypothetical protein [Bacteroidales bacterium]
MLKKDHYIFGIAIGIIVPIVLFGIIYLLNYLLVTTDIAKFYLDLQTHVLISLFGNLIPIRYYFVNLKYDKTGRGVLLITFLLVLVFFGFKDNFVL